MATATYTTRPSKVIIADDIVIINTNITEVEKTDMDGNTYTEYTADTEQMTRAAYDAVHKNTVDEALAEIDEALLELAGGA